MSITDVDVLVIGGNPGGCSAAIAAARSGASVVLLESTKVLGGMNANGTFGFDCATPQALSGIAEEVADRVRAYYAHIGLKDPLFEKRADLVWESHVLAGVWHRMVEETKGIRGFTRAVPVGVVAKDGRRFIDFLQEENALSPYDNLANQKWADEVRRLLGTLTPIESRIIRWRFGLDDEDELTLKEIGDKYNLSRERIRQLQEQALGKIRKQMRDF